MFSINPFAELSSSISPSIMQTYVIVMVALVVGGTLFDIVHKKSAKYFFNNWRKSKEIGTQDVGAGEMLSIAVKTAIVDVATTNEICNMRRRIAHLLTMYGFIAYVAATVCMVFTYATPGAATPAIVPQAWHIGALMVSLGGYWFWFFIRVDVHAEGNTPFRFVQADIFIVSLMVSTTLALAWSYLQSTGNAWTTVVLGAYLLVTTILFVSIPWSKFSHMFFKPAAAMEKRMSKANGSNSNLPAPADKPATLGDTRRQTNNY
jgi:predicted small integral membrane protein